MSITDSEDISIMRISGTKDEVWDGYAYQTSGKLIKDDLMISPRTGFVISIRKYLQGKKNIVYIHPDKNIL